MNSIPLKIGVSPTLKIRGVIATACIAKGTLIEECPIIKISKHDAEILEETVLDNYLYEWDEDFDCLSLGYAGLVNHSFEPNAVFERNLKDDMMEYRAIRDIQPGEEVTVNYNGDPLDCSPLDPGHTDFDNRHYHHHT
jgi:uncharacterized protein